MTILLVIQKALYVIGGVTLVIIGVWLYGYAKKQRSHYMVLSKEEWKDDNDMLPVSKDVDELKEKPTRPKRPTETPVKTSKFFANVRQARKRTTTTTTTTAQ